MSPILQAVAQIPISGIQALTTIDFPGKMSAVFFTQGCPWGCRYCHNPALRDVEAENLMPGESVEAFLRDRVDFLDGIVVSGGEPTLHRQLPDFLQWLRDFGYATALHTNGFFPSMLRRILKKGLVDYIAMDVKAPPVSYDRVTQAFNTCIAVARSIELILASGVDYEFRTTFHPDILSEAELIDTMRALASSGVKRYYLQRFRPQGVVDGELVASGDYAIIPEAAVEKARDLFEEFEVR